ncbi:ABC transporter permease [Paenibacillus sp. YN15]|uniref:ABC transporter permease n=1 Tax=Paenibacillus sp. YN15 TaxID=1742774 RepID=UPI00215B7F1E|nr:ABC transporter permease [Paenibacillus sp. YN15]
MKDLLALPVSRGRIVWAKLVSALIWCFVMTMATYGFAVLERVLFRMPGLTMDVAQHYFVQLLIICGMQLLLCGPVVFTASASRGYLAPVVVGLLGIAGTLGWWRRADQR